MPTSLVQVMFFLFSLYLIPFEDVPDWWRWMPYLSPQSFAYSAMMIREVNSGPFAPCYRGTCYDPATSDGPPFVKDYSRFIVSNESELWICYTALAGWYIVYFVVGAIFLNFKIYPVRPPNVDRQYDNTGDLNYFLTPEPVTLAWQDVTYTVKAKKGFLGTGGTTKKALLKGVSGIARPKTMTALMGPSGAGKTTLLDVLAGRKSKGKVEGEIKLNGTPKHGPTFLRVSGYVEQSDSNANGLTVKESLLFSAGLGLPKDIPDEEKLFFCETIAHALDGFDKWMLEPVYELTGLLSHD